jgi:hypothetical protein
MSESRAEDYPGMRVQALDGALSASASIVQGRDPSTIGDFAALPLKDRGYRNRY